MSPAERGLAALDKADAALVALTDIIGYLEAKQRLVDAAKVAISEMPQGAIRDALEKAIRECDPGWGGV